MSHRRTCLLMLGLLTAAPLPRPWARPSHRGYPNRSPTWPGPATWPTSPAPTRPARRRVAVSSSSAAPRSACGRACHRLPRPAGVQPRLRGSEVRDSTWYADRIVVPYAPCKVFFYAGDNDLNSGRSAVQVRDDVVAFVQRVHRDLPKTRVEYLSIKPSPSRAHLLPAINEANTLIKAARPRCPTPASPTSTRRCWAPMASRMQRCSARTCCT